MIAAGVHGFIAMLQFSQLARPTLLSSDHGRAAGPPAASAKSSIVRTAAQPPQREGGGIAVITKSRLVVTPLVVTRLGMMP